MRTTQMSRPLSRLFLVAAGAALALAAAMQPAAAREGSSSKSVGHGIKCYTVAVKGADGKITYEQVCRKGV